MDRTAGIDSPGAAPTGGDARFGFHVLHRHPLTLLTATRANATALIRALAAGPAPDPILIVMTWWSIVVDASEHVAIAREFERCCPGGTIRFLANDPLEQSIIARHGLPAWLCNHNCLVDETIYRLASAEPAFDAVYNASFHPYKRHYLAGEIDRLLLIGYAFDGADGDAGRILRALPRAKVANAEAGGGHRLLAPAEVADWLTRARVGLCLSAVEGAMYASIEYLLTGLPIVSTLSLGGRDVYFDPDFARIVDPDPTAIRDAVDGMARSGGAPRDIRERTLAKLRADRGRLLSQLDDLGVRLDGVDLARQWSDRLRHGLLRWGDAADLAQATGG